jgi:glycosyltransferase involved in cell wall biosynthesis
MDDNTCDARNASVTRDEPLVSIILCVRNGLPHVRDAVESVRSLSYSNYELIVQDGASTDGTLEYLQSVAGLSAVVIVSEPDTGIGQGFNRALRRCKGAIVGSVDADNLLRKDALALVVRRFEEQPQAAVIYGACDMVDAQGTFIHSWIPPEFDLLGLMEGAVVPPFATSFFSRDRCGGDLCFDEEFRTVADFDLWLRLAHRPIVRVLDVLADVRVGEQSSTWNSANYENQSGYKIRALRKFLAGPTRDRVLEKLYERAEAGIYLWAVDSMAVIDGGEDQINRYFEKATKIDIRSERFRDVLARARPKLPVEDPTLGARLLQCGIEYLQRCQPETALIYFEYLNSVGFGDPALANWIERGKKDRWEAQTQTEVANHLQAEVNRRDRILVDKEAWWSNEVVVRDKIIDHRRREIEWMRRGWRRWVIGRPPSDLTGERRD